MDFKKEVRLEVLRGCVILFFLERVGGGYWVLGNLRRFFFVWVGVLGVYVGRERSWFLF